MPARESARREETSSVIRPGHEDGSMKPREHLQKVLLILFARLNIRIWEKSRGIVVCRKRTDRTALSQKTQNLRRLGKAS
jgi:hypothetical protein